MTLSVFQSSVVNKNFDVQAGAEIEVVNEATGLPATLYSTRAGAVTTNPMFADADGFFRFYTDAGEYRITATSGVFSKTFRYVRVGDAGGKDASRVARGGDFMAYGGTANAFTLTSVNTLPSTSIQDGDKLRFKATATNTGSTTVTIDGGTVLTCKTPTGVNLPAGFIRTDVFTEGEVDGANFVVSRKVESGSDSNGEWTKWEDGTFKKAKITDYPSVSCTSSSGAVFISTNLGGDSLGITLASVTARSIHVDSDNSDGILRWATSSSIMPSNSTYSTYRIVDSQSSAAATVVTQTVEGKWY